MELWTTERKKKKSERYRSDIVAVLVTVLFILISTGVGGYLILREVSETVPGVPFLAGVFIGCILCLGLLSGQRKCVTGSGVFLTMVLAAGAILWKQILSGGIFFWNELFYPQLGVKLCSMAGGGVQKIYMVFLREPSRRDRSGSDLFHLRDGFEIKMNFDRNVSCFIFVNALMHDDFFD